MADFLTQAWPFAAAVLVVLGAIALVVLIVILIRAAKTMDHVSKLAEQAEAELTPTLKRIDPLVDRAELTVDTINLELLRVDSILEDVEQVTNVAGKTADTVNTVTAAPTEAVVSLVDRVRGALGSKRKNKAKAERFVYPIGSGETKKEAPAPEQPAEETIEQAAQHIAEVQGKHSVDHAAEQPAADEPAAEVEDVEVDSTVVEAEQPAN